LPVLITIRRPGPRPRPRCGSWDGGCRPWMRRRPGSTRCSPA